MPNFARSDVCEPWARSLVSLDNCVYSEWLLFPVFMTDTRNYITPQ